MLRENIYGALFAQLQTTKSFKTISRHARHCDDLSAPEFPALFQLQKSEKTTQKRGLPTVWQFELELYVYVLTPSDKISGSVILNKLMDEIELALSFDPIDGTNTLNGLVSHCWINGSVQIMEGLLGNKTVAIIPIEILVNK